MKKEEEEDWTKLVSLAHIDSATKHVKRLSMAFHSAFVASYIASLDLDRLSLPAGEYLLKKFISENCLFQHTAKDLPQINDVIGPKSLLTKLKKSKGVTMKRCTNNSPNKKLTELETDESKRKKCVEKEAKQLDRFSSKFNACQAIVHPDGSKPKVQKSTAVPKALETLIKQCLKVDKSMYKFEDVVMTRIDRIPTEVSQKVKFAIVEFAGIKFKAYAESGNGYLQFVKKAVFEFIYCQFPHTNNITICEEKYKFTPDILKSLTRSQRTAKTGPTISHLKPINEILNENSYDRKQLCLLHVVNRK